MRPSGSSIGDAPPRPPAPLSDQVSPSSSLRVSPPPDSDQYSLPPLARSGVDCAGASLTIDQLSPASVVRQMPQVPSPQPQVPRSQRCASRITGKLEKWA